MAACASLLILCSTAQAQQVVCTGFKGCISCYCAACCRILLTTVPLYVQTEQWMGAGIDPYSSGLVANPYYSNAQPVRAALGQQFDTTVAGRVQQAASHASVLCRCSLDRPCRQALEM